MSQICIIIEHAHGTCQGLDLHDIDLYNSLSLANLGSDLNLLRLKCQLKYIAKYWKNFTILSLPSYVEARAQKLSVMIWTMLRLFESYLIGCFFSM